MLVDTFLKWAGSKKSLISPISKQFPESYNRYYEPFIGSGALFFYLKKSNCYISDINEDLILTYKTIQNNLKEFIELLHEHKNKHCENYYFEIRNLDRDKIKFENMTDLERSARFLYLNKTGFNGLWRVNTDGFQNVSYNQNSDPTLFDFDVLTKCHYRLQNTEIVLGSYWDILEKVQQDDLVYLDPPYVSVTESDFGSYNKDKFDHNKVVEFLNQLTDRGVKFILSNSYCDETLELYKNYTIIETEAPRRISGNAESRGMIKEILVRNYELSDPLIIY